MKTPYIYNKYLYSKEIPVKVVYQALDSVSWRFANIERKHRFISAQEFYERYGEYEKRYPLQRDILLDIMDKYELRDRYNEFERHVVYRSIHDLVSAQYVTKLVKAFCEDGAVVVGLPDSGEQNEDRNASLAVDQPLYCMWTAIIPVSETDTGNIQSRTEAETVTSGME